MVLYVSRGMTAHSDCASLTWRTLQRASISFWERPRAFSMFRKEERVLSPGFEDVFSAGISGAGGAAGKGKGGAGDEGAGDEEVGDGGGVGGAFIGGMGIVAFFFK
jgi:hypothetical protein